ncbi:TPA: hypothetical protein MAQ57_005586, partial [Klebsiella pneumoniae]|nr:hypothetical protein [Klebsiella pneumoniae]
HTPATLLNTKKIPFNFSFAQTLVWANAFFGAKNMAFDPPIGSSAPEVLLKNAKNLDFAVNDITTAFWEDRFGQERKTWYGIESSSEVMRAAQQAAFISQFNQQAQKFDAQISSQASRYEAVLQEAGKTVLGRYEDGPWTLTSYNQLVSYGGTFWKLAASVAIGSGYTTAGTTESTWNATDKANFVDVGQDQLRSELGAIFMPGPSGNATTDVQLLKSALHVGGFINYNVPGKYLYNDSGVIKSGTSLHTSAGVDWHQDVNSAQWHPFLINNAYYASRFLVTSMTKLASYTNPWRDNAAT